MEKEKVIVWGTGTGFIKREDQIRKQFEIIAFTGNEINIKMFPYKDLFIKPKDIIKTNYNKILVCSIQYYETIKYQLIYKYHIEPSRIISIEEIYTCIEKDIEKEKIIFESVETYKRLNHNSIFNISDEDMWLITYDYNSNAGNPHKFYFAQDIWAATKICQRRPQNHVDIGSRLDGFIGHLLVALGKVDYIDIRPLPFYIEGLSFIQGDATNLENIPDNSIESLSSLHAVEHFGLGRYGDIIDPDACFKAMQAFARVLKPGGRLYFAVPIGPKNKLCFNAHRIFNPQTIITAFKNLTLKEFAVVIGEETNAKKVSLDEINNISGMIPYNSCGLFEFVK